MYPVQLNYLPNFNTPPPNLGLTVDQKIKSFLSTRRQCTQNDNVPLCSNNKLTISLAKVKFDNLQKLKDALRESTETEIQSLTNDELKQKTQKIEELKQEINLLENFLQSNSCNIKTLIQKRLRKRSRIKKRKKIVQQNYLRTLNDRKKKSELIDKNLKEAQKQIELESQQNLEKERTKNVLSSVQKRINEAKEKIELLDSLIELRRIRNVASQKDDECGQKSFKEDITRVKHVWEVALIEYEKEKSELKNVLQTSFGCQSTPEEQWSKVLFGDPIPKKLDHPLLRAEKNLNEFLRIRHEWDACIVPENSIEGTTIPIFWVLPDAQPKPEWSKYF